MSIMRRARVTFTMREELLRQLDRMVDNSTIRSRSQALEFVLGRLVSEHKLKSAVVLAGGKGCPEKFLADINGKSLLERAIGRIAGQNVQKIMVYSDRKAWEIEEAMRGKRFPSELGFMRSQRPSGTIEPLLKAKPRLDETFLVAYGDTVCALDVGEFLAFHRKNNSIASMALTTVSNPREFGVASLEGSVVREFEQKPRRRVQSYLVNAGIYLFEPEVFRHISRGMRFLETDLFPRLAQKGLLFGYPFTGLYLNVNSKADLERARLILK